MAAFNAFLGTSQFVVLFLVSALILPQNMCCIMILLRFIKIYSTITFHYYLLTYVDLFLLHLLEQQSAFFSPNKHH